MVHPVQSVVESLYAAGRCPRLHVNALAEGVICPDFIREQWQERLIIDLDSSYPLDLTFEDGGIGADLSFGGYVTRCCFPFTAIYVVADRATGRGIVLDQNMPDSVRRSRQNPTTGPLPPDDLESAFDTKPKAKTLGVAPDPEEEELEKPKKTDEPGAETDTDSGASDTLNLEPAAADGDSSPEPSAAEEPAAVPAVTEAGKPADADEGDEGDDKAKRRRAAFKVIDGGA